MNYFKKKNYHNTKPLWGWVIALISMGLIFACADSTSSSDTTEKTPTLSDSVLSGWREYNQNNPITKSTAGTPIGTLEELKAMTVDGEYHLTANIDLGTEDWAPLFPEEAFPFQGTLHGNGYIVYGLNINAPDKSRQGLFAMLDRAATINNLGIGVRSITANAVAGALAGLAVSPILTNIAVGAMDTDSTISVDDVYSFNNNSGGYVGGLVGYLAGNIYDKFTAGWNEGVAVRATGRASKAGGLVGETLMPITGSSSGDVSSESGNNVGGLVGNTTSTVTGSSSGDVSSESGNNVGGLVGNTTSTVTGTASGDVSSVSGNSVGGLVGNTTSTVTGTASGDVSSVSGNSVGGLVGYSDSDVTGIASGNVSSVSGQSVGGLVGGRGSGTIRGYSIGWVMTGKDSTQTSVGAVIGAAGTHNAYYNSDDGAGGTADHVGTIDEASVAEINLGQDGDTGKRGTNGLGAAIQGIANATATNMGDLTAGTEVGQWTFTAGQWPKVNLPDGVTDYVDYTTSPSAPANFVD